MLNFKILALSCFLVACSPCGMYVDAVLSVSISRAALGCSWRWLGGGGREEVEFLPFPQVVGETVRQMPLKDIG